MTAKQDFKKFKDTFLRYQKLFGLIGYKVYFKLEQIETGDFADICINQGQMVATVRLNSKLSDDDKPFSHIELSAKHEAIHLLLWKSFDLACQRYIRSQELNEADEELVVKLEKLIPDIKVEEWNR